MYKCVCGYKTEYKSSMENHLQYCYKGSHKLGSHGNYSQPSRDSLSIFTDSYSSIVTDYSSSSSSSYDSGSSYTAGGGSFDGGGSSDSW